MAMAWAARLRNIDSSAICRACGFRSVEPVAPIHPSTPALAGEPRSMPGPSPRVNRPPPSNPGGAARDGPADRARCGRGSGARRGLGRPIEPLILPGGGVLQGLEVGVHHRAGERLADLLLD